MGVPPAGAKGTSMARSPLPLRSLVVLALLGALGPGPAARADEPPAPPVYTSPVEEGQVAESREFVGHTRPPHRSLVASEHAGLVEERFVEAGDRVRAGQPLVRLRTREVDDLLAVARAEEALRVQELAELEHGARPEEVREAEADLALEAARRETLLWKLEAAEKLRTQGTLSEDEWRDAQLAVHLVDQRIVQAQAALALVRAGPRTERIEQARARLSAQQAVVARLEEQKRRMTVSSPLDGWVVSEHAEVGEWVAVGGAVVEIAALDEVDALVPVLEDHVAGVPLGARVAVTVPAVPGRVFEGEVRRIVPSASDRARTLPVIVRIPNVVEGDRPLLAEGMFVRVLLPVGKPRPALLVPKDALVLGGPQPMVYVVAGEGRPVQPVPVEMEGAVDGRVAVRGTLQAGQRVVVRGNERLRPGAPVRDLGDPPPSAAAPGN